MRPSSDIKSRIRALVNEELERRIVLATKRLPHMCQHNIRQPLDTRKSIEGEVNPQYNRITSGRGLPVVQSIGLCGVGVDNLDTWEMNICDEPIDALRCPIFLSKSTKETIVKELEGQLLDKDWLAQNMPEVSGLLWSLGDLATPPKLPWWKKILLKAKRVVVEPVSNPQLPE